MLRDATLEMIAIIFGSRICGPGMICLSRDHRLFSVIKI